MSIETVKLVNKKGEVIERYKHDYENNVERFNMRGWSLQNNKTVKTETVEAKKVIKKVKKKKTKK
tara:strand:- start:6552 stop:6746 length:195 start_codon:yes stop_codon:yes gene_type:complete